MDLGSVFMSEVLGTGTLVLLGAGVVANVLLTRSKRFDGGWLLINLGWEHASPSSPTSSTSMPKRTSRRS